MTTDTLQDADRETIERDAALVVLEIHTEGAYATGTLKDMGFSEALINRECDGMEFINGGFDGTTGLLLAKDAASKFLGHWVEYDCENRPLETIKQAIADRLSDRLTHFSVERVYELIRPLRCLSDERITAIGLALGGDGPDLEDHQRACSIEASLRSLRDTAYAIFYLLPDLDEKDD